MDYLRFTLVSEGTTDESLVPILKWAVEEQGISVAEGYFARWDLLPKRPSTVAEKIIAGLSLQDCDLLFVHRDADSDDPTSRREEIERAVSEARATGKFSVPAVPVVPIQETEAWLLLDEDAIRRAANNPNGKNDLSLPARHRIEQITNAKAELERALREATEHSGRRLRKFHPESAKKLIVNHLTDFNLLRQLSAFRQLEADLATLSAHGWKL
jgi:hypothetical protein